MFRIKNVRNSTVNKQSNISPAHNQPKGQVSRFQNKVGSKLPVQRVIGSRMGTNRKLTGNAEKVHLIESKVLGKVEPQKNVKLNNHTKKQQAPPSKLIPVNKKVQKQVQEVQKRSQIICQQKQKEIKVVQNKNQKEAIKSTQVQTTKIQNKDPPILEQDIKQQKLEEFIKKEESARKRAAEMQKRTQEEQLQKKKKEQQRERRRQERRREQEKQKQRQLQLKKMMQKAHARKKAREEEFQRKKKEQQQRKKQSEQHGIAGLVSLNDPLAHIEMSEAIMDRQINKLLSMKFANFPNKQQIQHQLQQLQRINTSYLLVRQDPNNPLIRGLSNFRIQLFNRVGELIMKGQAELGPQASGLQVIQTDSHHNNRDLVQGVKITRGLENQVKNVLKTIKLKKEQECPICLGAILIDQQIYSVKCGHIFHLKCLQSWLVNTANCPACRYNIKYDHY